MKYFSISTPKLINHLIDRQYPPSLKSDRRGAPGKGRRLRTRSTSDQQEKINRARPFERATVLINANFGYGDIHLTLDDIAPKLYEKVKNEFQRRFEKSKKIKALRKKIEKEESTYKDAGAFAIETGEILSDVFLNHISSDTLPNGRLHYNIADRVVRPMLEEDYNLISDHAAEVQKILNRKAKIGIKSIKPELNQDKVQGIIDIVSGKDNFDDIAYMLGDPIVNFSQTIVDDTVKVNADFQYKAGLSPEIRRISTGKCCKRCNEFAGTYKYEDVYNTGNEVFRRHKNCRCIVEYDGKNGKRQNVHTKQWSKPKSSDKMKNKEKSEETPGKKRKESRKRMVWILFRE